MKALHSQILCLSVGLFAVFSFQNCANRTFTSIDGESKAAKLSTETIFGPNAVATSDGSPASSGSIPVTGSSSNADGDEDDSRDGTITAGGSNSGSSSGSGSGSIPGKDEDNDDEDDGDEDDVKSCGGRENPVVVGNEIPVRWICSDSDSRKDSNVASSQQIRVEVKDSAGAVACTFNDANLRSIILTQKKFSMASVTANCPQLQVGSKYRLELSNVAKSASTNLIYKGASFSFTKQATDYAFNMSNMPVLADFNDEPQVGLEEGQCEETHSPLVIRFDTPTGGACGQEHLLLSAPNRGILFDILGANAKPAPYTKQMVSWASTKKYHFVTLPNAQGQVSGIDQLFGDNTKGPDGAFSANGYAALAKFDGMSADGKTRLLPADGQITAQDAIFSQLRLWNDANQDGESQAVELKTLNEMGVVALDLDFDPNYYEMDIYGNEVKFKSVIQTKDGRLHTMFDLWFVLGQP